MMPYTVEKGQGRRVDVLLPRCSLLRAGGVQVPRSSPDDDESPGSERAHFNSFDPNAATRTSKEGGRRGPEERRDAFCPPMLLVPFLPPSQALASNQLRGDPPEFKAASASAGLPLPPGGRGPGRAGLTWLWRSPRQQQPPS